MNLHRGVKKLSLNRLSFVNPKCSKTANKISMRAFSSVSTSWENKGEKKRMNLFGAVNDAMRIALATDEVTTRVKEIET